jgi:hypothetical protein
MKMIKKAKIINISLNSPKHQSPTIHLAHSHSTELLQQSSEKQAYIMDHAYEALKLIGHEKGKALNADKKVPNKSTPDLLKLTKRADE